MTHHTMATLFDKDPAFTHPRDRRGRFATPEHVLYEKTAQENKYLRLQLETYKRQAEALSRSVSTLERKLAVARELLNA